MEREMVFHAFPPVWDPNSRVLILGTMPSPRSRENGFYYTHPQNRFWPVLSSVLGEPLPQNNEERRALALRRGVALWDVLASCEIRGADDGSISRPQPNDIAGLLARTGIRAVFTTGTKAAALYRRHCLPHTGREAVPLPSTSPANCRWYTRQRLEEVYAGALLPFLQKPPGTP
ncbi:MAG: DNA-deoxyinosine glycosylase [Oscillospiraceae bacterium]|nr:DNA-deoxyinosine glycosylase [Oscillospiraceae bacterium]